MSVGASGEDRAVEAPDLEEAARRFGTPSYLYDLRQLAVQVAKMRAVAGPETRILYSVKANPCPAILEALRGHGLGAEVASGGELGAALAAGFAPGEIAFAGPGKSHSELAAAVDAGLLAVHVESAGEILRLEAAARSAGRRVSVALRLHPAPPASGGRSGWPAASPFGIADDALDDALAALARCRHLDVRGLHVHRAAEMLDGELAARLLEPVFESALELTPRLGLTFLNVGGGWGIPIYEGEDELDGSPLRRAFDRFRARSRESGIELSLQVESGRFLLGPCGTYLTRVVDVKQAGGKRFAVLDGGMHHLLLRSSAFRRYRQKVRVSLPGRALGGAEESWVPTEVVGPLCTPVDRLASDLRLPADLRPGEILAFPAAGAYGKYASPLTFLGHPWPAEVCVDETGMWLAARRVEFAELLALQRPSAGSGGR